MHHTFTLVAAAVVALIACSGLGKAECKASGTLPDIHRANRSLLAVLRIPTSQLHVRHIRVSETMALPTLASQHAVLSLS